MRDDRPGARAAGAHLGALARHVVPRRLRHAARRALGRGPAVGAVRFGDLRGAEPIGRAFGFDRGLPIDRHYVEGFLARNADDIRGRVLEVAESTYTRRFGGDRVTAVEVLHVEAGHSDDTTVVDDLTVGANLGDDVYDCVVLTQTLHHVFDLRAALATVHRILAPGGVLLATDPGISQISRYDADRWGDFWRFTSQSARRLVEEAFPGGVVEIEPMGSALTAVAFLQGLAVEDLRPDELARRDPDYELVLGIRAVKAATA